MVDLHGTPTYQRSWHGLGRSFQDGRLFPGLTVDEAIAVALEQHVDVRDPIAATLHLPSVSDSEQAVHDRVDELIELLALGAYRDKFVRELSTGTRRVVDLACVLAQQPSVLLLDEPSSGIAQREAEALAPMLRRVRDELGASLLVIEHDLPLLGSISDRMIALDLGRRGGRGLARRSDRTPCRGGLVPRDRRGRHHLIQCHDSRLKVLSRHQARKEPSMSTTDETKAGGDVTPPPPKKSNTRRMLIRYGPIAVVVVLIAAAVLVFGGGGGDDDDQSGSATINTDEEALISSGPMTPQKAELEGEDVDFGPRCDTTTGRIMLVSVYAPPCVEPFTGDNGGETAQGVTGDTVKIVYYRPDPALDPLLAATVEGAGRTSTRPRPTAPSRTTRISTTRSSRPTAARWTWRSTSAPAPAPTRRRPRAMPSPSPRRTRSW